MTKMNGIKTSVIISNLEMTDLFKVEMVNGQKVVNRWGFFVNQMDGTYAIYKPENTVVDIDDSVITGEENLGSIKVVSAKVLFTFIDSIKKDLKGISGIELNSETPCGWYYDTLIPVEEELIA